MLARASRLPRLFTAAPYTALPPLPLPFLRNAHQSIAPARVCDSPPVASRLVCPSLLLGFTSTSVSARALLSAAFWNRQGGVHWSGGFFSRSFYVASVRNQRYGRNGNTSGESSPEGSSRSPAVQPLQPSHLQSSLVVDDFRSLIASKKREVAILEAALDILETAPRDKRLQDLVRKHNIQLEPSNVSVTQPEKWSDVVKTLPSLGTDSPTLVLRDLAVKSDIEFQLASTVEPTSQIVGSSKVEKDSVENVIVGLEAATLSGSPQDGRWNTAQLPSPKVDSTMVGQLPLDPPPQDPNFDRLEERRGQEFTREHDRTSKIESLNFGAAAKSAVGGSNLRDDSPVDPLRPPVSAVLEQPDKKPYRSLADRLYEEQFGRPAPPGLKRTYPKGSFYDRCMKEKEQKERDAAAAARNASPFPPWSVSSSSSRRTESEVSVSFQRDDARDNSIRKNVLANDINQKRQPGAWKCPECTFFNLAAVKYCYRCQAQRGENGRGDGSDSGGRSTRERKRGRELEEAPLREDWKV